MARIEQYSYPFNNNAFNFVGHICRIGVSISESLFMALNSTAGTPYTGFYIVLDTDNDNLEILNNLKIYIGRTCMYEMDNYLHISKFLIHPEDVKTALILVIYDLEREGEINE